jgi:O-antigen/teichoic acid export membrane protein
VDEDATGGPPAEVEREVSTLEPDDLLATSAAGPAAVRGGAMRVGSYVATALVGIATAALLFRHLGVVDTGRYTTALVLAAVVTGLTDLGLTSVGIRELTVLRGPARAELASNLLGIRVALTTLGVLAVTVFALIAYDSTLAIGVLIAGVSVIVQNVQVTLEVPLMAALRLGQVALLDLARQVLASALVVALVLAGAGLLPFLATVGVAAAVVLVPTAMLVRNDIPLRPSFRLAEWRTLLRPVLTYSVAVAAGALYFRIAIVLVSLIAGGHQLGYFSVSYRVIEGIFVLPGLLVGAAFPIFARAAQDDPERLGYAISRVFEVSLLCGVWVALTLAIGAELAIRIVGGAEFLGATKVLAIQGVAVGATFVSAVWAFAMLSLHLHRLILVFNLAMLALVTAVVAALVPIDGARGAAIGVAAVEVVGALWAGRLLVRGRRHLVPRMRVVPRAALAALLGAAPALLGGLPILVRIVLSSVIYLVVLLVLRAPPAEVYDVLPRRWRRWA